MKKSLSLLAMVFALGLSTVAMDAEAARRMGGGKSLGMQRDATPPKAPTATPAQTPSAAPGAAAAAPAAAAASNRSKWLGPIAGLAAGIGLMALASHLGFGEGLANMLMIGLMIMAVLAVVGMVMRKRAAAQAGSSGGMAYAGAGAAGGSQPMPAFKAAMPPTASGGSMIGAGIGANAPTGNRIPADFDVAGFVRNAKVNFIRLQAANDAGNLDDLRQFTTPEMFAELKMDLADRGAAEQHTDVVRIDGDVIDVEENADGYVVSVRFTGETREGDGAETEAFDEIWHLSKPRHGSGGWLLAGIQQMQ
ncbi:Tim44 domain-containing protein [Hydrogenophaga sp.]|uniref:Tim44 domain-containing protein n=1 Tax=Hydrogenophaga sp. TaxID=1904254 RepID=UPI003F6BF547